MLKRSRSAYVQFSTPSSFLLLFFLFQCLFFFLLLFSAASFGEVQRLLLFFLFSSRVPFFSAQNVFASAHNTFLVQPKKYYFQPKTFLLQPKILFQFSPKISPCLWFSASCFLFLFFLPFFSAFSHYVLPFFIPSVQLKTFSATSCFFI